MRISGVNLPNKRFVIALTYIYGIGKSAASKICMSCDICESKRTIELTEEEADMVRSYIRENLVVEGDLRKVVGMNVKNLIDLGCYRGLRHRKGLPMRSRTRTNARTRKGRSKGPIAGKKK